MEENLTEIQRFLRKIGTAKDRLDIGALRTLFLEHPKLLYVQLENRNIRLIDNQSYMILSLMSDDRAALDFLKLLIEFGVDVNASSYVQSAIGPIASAAGRTLDIVKLLRDHGAYINHDLFGQQACWPLISAVCANKLDIVKYLVEQGGVINFVNIHGMSPLDYARNFPEIADYLKSLGAKPGSELPRDHLPQAKEPDPHASIRQHLEHYFGDVEEFPLHEIIPGDPPISFLKVPRWDNGCVGLVTDGMSSRAMNVPEGTVGIRRAELAFLIDSSWPLTEEAMKDDLHRWPLDWARKIARWPFETDTYLRPVTIIANGDPPRPLGDNPGMTSLIVRANTESEWGRWTRPDGEVVDLLFLSPLYTSEREYELQHGLIAFLKMLEENYFSDYVDLTREPFV